MRALVVVLLLLAPWVQASPSWIAPYGDSTDQERLRFWTGYSLFRSPWVAAPASTTGRDGLGPYFNARSCDACHRNGTGGTHGQQPAQSVVRVGSVDQPGVKERYGEQLQVFAAVSVSAPEVHIELEWQKQTVQEGARRFEVAVPQLTIVDSVSGRPVEDLPASLRLAPPLFGLGLLERIEDDQVLAREDPEDRNADGISGRASWVDDPRGSQPRLGRFGHKAERFNIQDQVAAALREDIGITSALYPAENCTVDQPECLSAPNGASIEEGVEISAEKLARLSDFVQLLQAPVKTAQPPGAGAELFAETGCAACHVPDLLAHPHDPQPYTDLLLHDLGPNLADSRRLANAEPAEWRTTPLWGLGRKLAQTPVSLLHDGRADSLDAAIYWHAGEAAHARNAYFALDPQQQQALTAFLQSL